MTIKKYYEDPYLQEYQARVLDIIPQDGYYKVITDETIFYPEGGGQPADHGTIDGVRIFDVQEKDGVIYHYAEDRPAEGIVHMKIDWARRYDLMQQHTGEHVLSGMILRECAGNNKGFHLGAELVTIDIDIPKMSRELLDRIEEKVNQKILQDIAVRSDITDADGLSGFPIRKQIAAEGDIRVVSIEGTDCCACCGIHLRSLAEVRMLKIIKTEQYKGMTRMSFVCGERAVRDYNKRFEITRTLRQEMNSDDEHLLERIIQTKKDLEQAKEEIYGYKLMIAKHLAKECRSASNGSVFELFDEIDHEILLHLGDILQTDHESLVLGSVKDGRLIARTKKDIDLGLLFKEGIKDIGGKGGGKGPNAQAIFPNTDMQKRFIAFLKQELERKIR